jgi:hypothetical protein
VSDDLDSKNRMSPVCNAFLYIPYLIILNDEISAKYAPFWVLDLDKLAVDLPLTISTEMSRSFLGDSYFL